MSGVCVRDGRSSRPPTAEWTTPSPLRVATRGRQTTRRSRARPSNDSAPKRPRPATRGRRPRARALAELLRRLERIPAFEALDQYGLIVTRLLPEWAPVRSRVQHNPYHRFTVDRHLLEAAAQAAALLDRAAPRPPAVRARGSTTWARAIPATTPRPASTS